LATQDIVDPKQIEKIKQSNLARLEVLAQQGITLSVGDLAFLKMEAVIELFVSSPQDKLKLELLVEKKKKEVIDQVMAEIRKQQITQGVGQGLHRLPNLRN
jgi:radical SAM superfamily enzyme